MRDKKIILWVLPFLITNQSFFPFWNLLPDNQGPVNYQFDINSKSEHTITIDNDSNINYYQKLERRKFLEIEKRLANLEKEEGVLLNDEHEIQLGMILASMSGGVLFGRKEIS
ncbi:MULTISPECIES: hypothetical protein [unclassified Enterococcus]|uniref:hypothetical protein n=1 Tax=unclassified Enterococcus TaxID=2608891 RepID=UPI0015543B4C|nr:MULTISPECIES: hypothetical protein [unclassified Enterococcus]MBS7577112.1 hypothetical protein [Enterococcus sp. MMGLQ5-2]MBS7584441.1 hypothetical protein [Enterococcus sp. MMGLQ5-1]NPD12296.1 hypothetical protein [Enterococcus sp. MMGLQ5-1]NPD36946.1 hypothetical protein [Enterococcus sp. MMGLQ5-2]